MDEAFGIGFLIGWLIVIFVLSYFVGKFAESRGRSFGFGFLISFLLSPILGFIIVWVVTASGHSDHLIGGRLSTEEYLRAEQLRLQLRRTELSWKMFSNLLYLSLFIGGAYYLYHHPGPLRPFRDRLLAGWEVPSPSSAPALTSGTTSPVSLRRFSSVAEAQKEAMRLYPALGVAGSPFNRAFLARHKLYQQQQPEYFRDVSWPITLAKEVSTEVNSQ